MADVVNTYIVNIMSLPVINGKDPAKINEFYKQLRYNVQSLDTLQRLADVKGNVRATPDKLKGIKADLVHGKEDWQNWEYEDLKALKTWREIKVVGKEKANRGSTMPMMENRDHGEHNVFIVEKVHTKGQAV